MESRWYELQGQSLEANVSTRVHALHITKSGWNKINKHLDRKKIVQDSLDKEEARKTYLNDGSKSMTKEWENSLENIRKRREQEKLDDIERWKKERDEKFIRLSKEQEEKRQKFIAAADKKIFLSSGYAKEILSALMLSEVTHQREKQIEFKKELQKFDEEENLKFSDIIKHETEQDKIDKISEKSKLIEKEKNYAEMLKKCIEERHEIEKKQKEEQVKQEAADNEKAAIEIAHLQALEREAKLRRKRELHLERKENVKYLKELEKAQEREDKKIDLLIETYKDTKNEIDCLKKAKELEVRKAMIKRRQRISEMVTSEEVAKFEAENATIQKACLEMEAAEKKRLEAKIKRQEEMKMEIQEYRRHVQERERLKKQKEKELKKWDFLNSCKKVEVMKKYDDDERKKQWKKIIDYRNELLEQMEENKLEQQRAKEIGNAFVKTGAEEEDRKFLNYANETIELAKRRGRNIEPIQRVKNAYMKRIQPTKDKENRNCRHQQ